MSKHEGDQKEFYVSHEAYYADALPPGDPEIIIGFYSPEGGTSGEFAIRWKRLSGGSVPRLEVFSDGWSALASMPGLIEALRGFDGSRISPGEMTRVLLSLGFRDRTQREAPPDWIGTVLKKRKAALAKLTDEERRILRLPND